MSLDQLESRSEQWGMPYEVWKRPDGSRYIKIDPKDIKSQQQQDVIFPDFSNIGDADASELVASAFRGSVWE